MLTVTIATLAVILGARAGFLALYLMSGCNDREVRVRPKPMAEAAVRAESKEKSRVKV